jgi:hypothetical protein
LRTYCRGEERRGEAFCLRELLLYNFKLGERKSLNLFDRKTFSTKKNLFQRVNKP